MSDHPISNIPITAFYKIQSGPSPQDPDSAAFKSKAGPRTRASGGHASIHEKSASASPVGSGTGGSRGTRANTVMRYAPLRPLGGMPASIKSGYPGNDGQASIASHASPGEGAHPGDNIDPRRNVAPYLVVSGTTATITDSPTDSPAISHHEMKAREPLLIRAAPVRIAIDALLAACPPSQASEPGGMKMDMYARVVAPMRNDSELYQLGLQVYRGLFDQNPDWHAPAASAIAPAAARLASGASKDSIDLVFAQLALGHTIDNAASRNAIIPTSENSSPGIDEAMNPPGVDAGPELAILNTVRLRLADDAQRRQLEVALEQALPPDATLKVLRIARQIINMVAEMANEAFQRRAAEDSLRAANERHDMASPPRGDNDDSDTPRFLADFLSTSNEYLSRSLSTSSGNQAEISATSGTEVATHAGPVAQQTVTAEITADITAEMTNEAFQERMVETLLMADEQNDVVSLHLAIQHLYKLDFSSGFAHKSGVDRCVSLIKDLPQPLRQKVVDAFMPPGKDPAGAASTRGLDAYLDALRSGKPPIDRLSHGLRQDQQRWISNLSAAASILGSDNRNGVPAAGTAITGMDVSPSSMPPWSKSSRRRAIFEAIRRRLRPSPLERARKEISRTLKIKTSSELSNRKFALVLQDWKSTTDYADAAQVYVSKLAPKERAKLGDMVRSYVLAQGKETEKRQVEAIATALRKYRALHDNFIPAVSNTIDALHRDPGSATFVNALDQLAHAMAGANSLAEAQTLCESAVRELSSPNARAVFALMKSSEDQDRLEQNIESFFRNRQYTEPRNEALRLMSTLRRLAAAFHRTYS